MMFCALYFSSKSGKLATNDIDTYVPVGQAGDKQNSLSGDAIWEEETEASNSEGHTAVTDAFKHPSALVWQCNEQECNETI
jgi:hypothetical protein